MEPGKCHGCGTELVPVYGDPIPPRGGSGLADPAADAATQGGYYDHQACICDVFPAGPLRKTAAEIINLTAAIVALDEDGTDQLLSALLSAYPDHVRSERLEAWTRGMIGMVTYLIAVQGMVKVLRGLLDMDTKKGG